MRRLRLSDQARQDIVSTWEYVAEDSIAAADRLVQRLVTRCKLLADTPGMGVSRDELRPGLRSVPVGNHLILYQPVDDGIAVFRIVHGARNLELLLAREVEETYRFDDDEPDDSSD